MQSSVDALRSTPAARKPLWNGFGGLLLLLLLAGSHGVAALGCLGGRAASSSAHEHSSGTTTAYVPPASLHAAKRPIVPHWTWLACSSKCIHSSIDVGAAQRHARTHVQSTGSYLLRQKVRLRLTCVRPCLCTRSCSPDCVMATSTLLRVVHHGTSISRITCSRGSGFNSRECLRAHYQLVRVLQDWGIPTSSGSD